VASASTSVTCRTQVRIGRLGEWPLRRPTTGSEDPFSQALAYLKFFHSLRRGEEHAVTTGQWREIVLGLAMNAAADGGVVALRKLVALRAVLRECEDGAGADSLTKLISDFRAELLGGRVPDIQLVLSNVSTVDNSRLRRFVGN
jgi:hypothetical protein